MFALPCPPYCTVLPVSVTLSCRCLSKFGFKLVKGMERDLVDSLTQNSSHFVRYEDFTEALRADIK